ncbi:MAG: AAA family ATPase [Eubacteriales bacterium]|nr:AAA family ATPase [Eubacteriales bacterium]
MTTELQEFLSHFKNVKPYNGYYMAMCPVHNKKDTTLSIKQVEDGKILLHCHRECKTEDIVAAAELTMADLFPDRHSAASASRDFKKIEQPPKKQPKPWKQRYDIAASYEYRDDGGHLLAVKDRYYKDGKKQQCWRHQDRSGAWYYGAGGVELPLYKHECISNPVFLVEGEKDVDTMLAGGLHAVTNPNGAGEWKDRYTEQLRGYDVCIIPDNDAPGRKHAETAANALHGVAASVKLLDLSELWPDIPEKGDVTDYVEWCRSIGRKDGDIFNCLSLARDGASEFVPNEDNTKIDTVVDFDWGMFRPLNDFEEVEPEWLVPRWIPKEQITIFASEGGVGKTSMVCDIAAAISNGGQCILDAEDIERNPAKVLFMTTEDSISKKLRKQLRLAGANMQNIFAPDPQKDKEYKALKIKFGSPELEAMIEHFKPALCIFDPIQGYVPPNINMISRNAMRDCLAPLIPLGEKTGCTFILVCHSNKKRGAFGRERISDSSDLWDIARSVIMAGYTDQHDKKIRYVSNEKNSYATTMQTILFSIGENRQIVFEGHSDKSDYDFSTAIFEERAKKPPEPLNEKLLEALKDAASPFDAVKFFYAEFEEKYGATIYGGKQPKKALDLMKPHMEEAGYSLITKQIKIGKQGGKGFVIQPINDNEPEQIAV